MRIVVIYLKKLEKLIVFDVSISSLKIDLPSMDSILRRNT